jgi:hypothetical protein
MSEQSDFIINLLITSHRFTSENMTKKGEEKKTSTKNSFTIHTEKGTENFSRFFSPFFSRSSSFTRGRKSNSRNKIKKLLKEKLGRELTFLRCCSSNSFQRCDTMRIFTLSMPFSSLYTAQKRRKKNFFLYFSSERRASMA